MALIGKEVEQLRDALANAFDADGLEQMLKIKLETELDLITSSGNLKSIAFRIIKVAEQQGWTDKLITAAFEYNPGNPKLQEFVHHYRARHPVQSINGQVEETEISSIHELITGITTLANDYATRISNFLVEYLGTPEQRVPFGGRESDLSALNNWIEDAEAPPYLFLAAPAGRGKSALLVQWSLQLLEHSEWSVAFIPVSIRYRTNLSIVFFTSLAVRLAQLRGEPIPEDTNTSVDIWRKMVANYLSSPPPLGRRILVVLDGIDEAADWDAGPELFPPVPPKEIRVVLSARSLIGSEDAGAWLESLGWTNPKLACALPLNPLDQKGVEEVLQSMEVPLDHLSTREEIVVELHRLSEGDPLLVRLYVQDLWARGQEVAQLSVQDLRNIQPGLEGYFDRWWEDQRRLWRERTPLHEPIVQTLLNILACAFGPLSIDDLQGINSQLSTWTIREAISSLARFVIGDGRKQGYVFSHSRLGTFFYNKLSDIDRQNTEQCFLDFGLKTLTDLQVQRKRPLEISHYLLQYHTRHLIRAKQYKALFVLVDDRDWYRAHMSAEPTGATYSNDLSHVWAEVDAVDAQATQRNQSPPYLGREIRSALALSSMLSSSRSYPAVLLTALLKFGLWKPNQALIAVRQNPDEGARAEAIVGIASYLPKSQIHELLVAAQGIDFVYRRALALAGLAPHLPTGLKEQALNDGLIAARSIEFEHGQVEALVALAPHFPEEIRTPLLQEALIAVQAEDSEYGRTSSLARLVSELPEMLLSEAVEMVNSFENEYCQAGGLKILAPYLSNSLLVRALEIACAINYDDYRAQALTGLLPYLEGQLYDKTLDEALQLGLRIEYEHSKVAVLADLVPHLTEPQKDEVLREAFSTASQVTNTVGTSADGQGNAVRSLASYLTGTLLTEALQIVCTNAKEFHNIDALSDFIPYVSDAQKQELLQQALDTIQASKYNHARNLSILGPHLTGRWLQRAIEIAYAIEDDNERARALVALVPCLSDEHKEELQRIAEDAVRKIDDTDHQFETILVLTQCLPILEKKDLLLEILEAGRSIKDPSLKASVWWRAALQLPDPLKINVLSEALEETRNISDESQARTLREIIPYLEGSLLDKALEIARTVRVRQSSVLLALALQFSDTQREKLLYEALDLTRTDADLDYRGWMLIHMSSYVPPDMKNALLVEAVDTGREYSIHIHPKRRALEIMAEAAERLPDIHMEAVLREILDTILSPQYEDELIDNLPHLAPFFPESLLRISLMAAQAIKHEPNKLRILAALAPCFAQLGQHQEAWELVKTITQAKIRAQGLANIGPYLERPLILEALNVAREIDNEHWRAKAIAGLAPRAVDLGALAKVRETAGTIHDERWRAMALAGVLSIMAEGGYLKEALTYALVYTGQDSEKLIDHLVPKLIKLPRRELFPLWRETLHVIATHARGGYLVNRVLLRELQYLVPVIATLGGKDAVVETCRAVLDTGRWWP